MTAPVPLGRLGRPVGVAPIRHFGRAVGENWRMQPVSDGAGGRARAKAGEGSLRA
jgi:hypothetical protein